MNAHHAADFFVLAWLSTASLRQQIGLLRVPLEPFHGVRTNGNGFAPARTQLLRKGIQQCAGYALPAQRIVYDRGRDRDRARVARRKRDKGDLPAGFILQPDAVKTLAKLHENVLLFPAQPFSARYCSA